MFSVQKRLYSWVWWPLLKWGKSWRGWNLKMITIKNSPATYRLVGRMYGEPNNHGSPSLFCNKEIGETLFSLPSCWRSWPFQSLTSDWKSCCHRRFSHKICVWDALLRIEIAGSKSPVLSETLYTEPKSITSIIPTRLEWWLVGTLNLKDHWPLHQNYREKT